MLTDDLLVKIIFNDDSELDIKAKEDELNPAVKADLSSFSIIMELDDQVDSVVGRVSSNELFFVLNNQSGDYSPSNTTSPLAGKIKEGVKVVVTNGLQPLGTYYVSDWFAPLSVSKRNAEIRCEDKLQRLLNNLVDTLDILSGLPLNVFIEEVFQRVGLVPADYNVDPSLTQVLDYGVVSGLKLSELLRDITKAGNCYIYVGLDDIVYVKSKDITGAVVHNFSDDVTQSSNTILRLNSGKSVIHSYNSLAVNYVTADVSEVINVLNISNIGVPSGVSVLSDYKTIGNVFEIDRVKVSASDNILVTGINATQGKISLDVNNLSLTSEFCTVDVFGKVIKTSESKVVKQDTVNIARNGVKDLTIKSKLIQSESQAVALADKYWTLINLDVPYIECMSHDSTFPYLLGDICQVVSNAVDYNYKGYIHTVRYDWVGGDALRNSLKIKYTT